MKIELIKDEFESKANGSMKTRYYTEVDGKYIDKSLSFDLNEATELYNKIVENKGELMTRQILNSVEI